MILWRIAKTAFADLSGEGARLHGGRWNAPGRAVVYLAEHPALALLEILVHLDLTPELLPDDFVLMKISIDAAHEEPTDAPAKDAGEAWLAAARTPLLRVPSALVPQSWNYLLNPAHPDAKAKIESIEALTIDPRFA